MNEGLERAVQQVKEEGLPPVNQMRAEVDERDVMLFRQQMQTKLTEYKALFDRFQNGEELTDEESKRMADLSDELSEATRRMRGEG